MSKPVFLVAIAGNIGAGKSTLTKYLSEQWHFDTVPEPEAKNPFLKDFYKNPKRWALHSQLFFLTERAKMQKKAEKNSRYLILDRTIYEDAEVFAKLVLSKNEYNVYKRVYDFFLEELTPPNFVVYLKASVPTLMERIKRRGRLYERNIKKSYIKKLDEKYDEWISSFKIAPVLTIDTDKYEIFSLFNDIDEVRERIEKFFWSKEIK
ncbi:MAG: deoxynucleoside kinase [Caldisericaceae bacterium]|nr:deoxynucleoside kinase [Caldisericaceae bacterium]